MSTRILHNDQISLELRLLECGLPEFILTEEDHKGRCVFDHDGWTVELSVGDTADHERIRYQCVQTDDGPKLLPDAQDPLLIGWLYSQLKQFGHPVTIAWNVSPFAHTVRYFGGPESFGDTLVEAMVSALEFALESKRVAK